MTKALFLLLLVIVVLAGLCNYVARRARMDGFAARKRPGFTPSWVRRGRM